MLQRVIVADGTSGFLPLPPWSVWCTNFHSVCAHGYHRIAILIGDVAQMGERSVRNAEVEGSIPFISTKLETKPAALR